MVMGVKLLPFKAKCFCHNEKILSFTFPYRAVVFLVFSAGLHIGFQALL